jgi:hypothetical protein
VIRALTNLGVAVADLSPPPGPRPTMLLRGPAQISALFGARPHSFEAPSRGSRPRCLRFAAFLPALAVVRPRKTSFRLVASLYRAGVDTPQGPE